MFRPNQLESDAKLPLERNEAHKPLYGLTQPKLLYEVVPLRAMILSIGSAISNHRTRNEGDTAEAGDTTRAKGSGASDSAYDRNERHRPGRDPLTGQAGIHLVPPTPNIKQRRGCAIERLLSGRVGDIPLYKLFTIRGYDGIEDFFALSPYPSRNVVIRTGCKQSGQGLGNCG